MVKTKASLAKPFRGRWRITSMEVWDQEAVDLVGPGMLELKGDSGSMGFIAVEAWLDVRYSVRDDLPFAEFSWAGMDECDPACGRGWVKLNADDTLEGRIFIHQGDDSAFACSRI